MMLNGCVRTGLTGRVAATVAAVAFVAVGCGGGSSFQYLESEDGHTFAKIPSGWTITREGTVAWSLLNEQNPSLGFVSGDDTTPWRAVFTADGRGSFDVDRPAGLIEVQHVDARMRDNFQVGAFMRTVPSFHEDDPRLVSGDIDIVEQRRVRLGDLEGFRVLLESDGLGRQYDQLILTDDERRAFYLVSVSCSADCLAQHADDVEEILTTFRVES